MEGEGGEEGDSAGCFKLQHVSQVWTDMPSTCRCTSNCFPHSASHFPDTFHCPQNAARLEHERKVAAMREWNDEELRMLDKAVAKFPQVGVGRLVCI